MKTPKHTKGRIRISKNTDGTDIDQECIGLDSWIEGDSTNKLNSNRGLHIQIRHNQDDDTFEASNRIAHLIAAAPDMFDALETLLAEIESQGINGDQQNKTLILNALKKAKGES